MNTRTNSLQLRLFVLVLMAVLSTAYATIERYSYTNLNQIIPDGAQAGLIDVRAVESSIRNLSAVRVKLNISGSFNGDLYAYVRHVNAQATNFCVLLNRSGRSATSAAGYNDAGMNITLDSGASTDVHLYRTITNVPDGTVLTGTWQPDGRNASPYTAVATSDRNTSLGSFNGVDGGGEWTLFVADLDVGATNRLVDWELELVGAIEPQITWPAPDPVVYGTPLGTAQLNASAGGVSGTFIYTPAPGTVLTVGPDQSLSVAFVPADAADYVSVTSSVPLTVLKAPLAVAGNNTNRVYGNTNPVFTGTITGIKNGENIVATYACGATLSSPIGNYSIIPSLSGATLTNYDVTAVNGTLTVNPAPLTVTGNNANRFYGDPNPAFTGSTVGIKNGENITTTYTCSATPSSPVGSYHIVPSPTGATLANYALTLVNGTFTVNPALLTVMATSTNRLYGTPNPPFTGSITGVKNSELIAATYGCTATVGSPAGIYDIIPSPSGATLINYTVTLVKGALTITRATCSGIVSSSSNPQLPGQPVTFSVTLTPIAPTVGAPAGTVQFKLDGAPAGLPVTLAAGIANYTTSTLTAGTHTVVAEYSGSLNFVGTTNTLVPIQLINTPPVANPDTIERFPSSGVTVEISTLLSNDFDPDGDLVSFLAASATSANGASISRQGDSLLYQPPSGFTNIDSFTYTIDDGRNAAVTGSVTVRLKAEGPPPTLSILDLGTGSYRLRVTGTPDRSCVLQYTPTFSPSNWTALTNGMTSATGLLECIDTPQAGAGSRFYRAFYP